MMQRRIWVIGSSDTHTHTRADELVPFQFPATLMTAAAITDWRPFISCTTYTAAGPGHEDAKVSGSNAGRGTAAHAPHNPGIYLAQV